MNQQSRRGMTSTLVVWMTVAHISVSAIIVLQQVDSYYESTTRNLTVLADAASLAILDAIAFDDRKLAERDLRTFGADPDIREVCVWDQDDLFFVHFVSPGNLNPASCVLNPASEPRLSWNELTIRVPMQLEGANLGTIWISADPAPLRQRVATSLLISLGLLAGSIATAAFLSNRILSRLELEVERRTRDLELANNEAKEANQAKSRFIANMSHELRTPMNGVLGTVERLFDTGLSAIQVDLVERALASGQNLLSMLNSVLDFTKAEAGMLKLEDEDCDLQAILGAVLETHQDVVRSKDISLESFVDDKVPAWIRTDAGGLQRVLHNLVGNAIKFTKRGGVEVHVGFSGREGSERVTFSVRDTGIGIDPTHHERLFMPFSQADDSTTRHFDGTGLGLVISRQVLQSLGGEIRFTSHQGKGSTFSFWLPYKPATPGTPKAAARARSKGVAPPVLRGAVLVVEDSEVNCEIAQAAVLATGCSVKSAANGKIAVALVTTLHFDAILMDCHMPTMDGFEATHRIRSLPAGSPTARNVPIIAVTANADAEERERCITVGMDDFVTKPFSRAALWDAMANALQGQGDSRPDAHD